MNICAYFDWNYLEKGMACYQSLVNQNPNIRFFVVCLDEKTYDYLYDFKDNIVAIKLKDVEKYFPRLPAVKHNRLLKEYFATMSPIVPMYIFDTYPEVDILFYTDADIAFWSDPEEMLEIFGDKSLMVTDHGFEPPRSNVRFNVGILGYRNDEHCREFLEWWADRCLEWCKWVTLPNGMCADQGYLNIIHDQPDRFKNTLECPHPGINMGPWNIAKYNITQKDGKPIIDNKYNLICYHYHEFVMKENSYYPTGWKITNNDKKYVYDPYYWLVKKLS